MKIPNELFFEYLETLLAEGREVELRVKGYSMRPLLRSGRDVVVLKPCDGRKVQLGDLVLCRIKGRHILHRIVRIGAEEVTLAGDGNYRVTERCTRADIKAAVVRIIRPSGRVIECGSTTWQRQSRCWLALPPWIRRQLLRVLWHIGYR